MTTAPLLANTHALGTLGRQLVRVSHPHLNYYLTECLSRALMSCRTFFRHEAMVSTTCKMFFSCIYHILIFCARYLHLGFRAPERLIQPARVHAIWAAQRLKHPLLSAHIVSGPDVSSARFEYIIPESVDKAIQTAAEESDIRTSSKDGKLYVAKTTTHLTCYFRFDIGISKWSSIAFFNKNIIFLSCPGP